MDDSMTKEQRAGWGVEEAFFASEMIHFVPKGKQSSSLVSDQLD